MAVCFPARSPKVTAADGSRLSIPTPASSRRCTTPVTGGRCADRTTWCSMTQAASGSPTSARPASATTIAAPSTTPKPTDRRSAKRSFRLSVRTDAACRPTARPCMWSKPRLRAAGGSPCPDRAKSFRPTARIAANAAASWRGSAVTRCSTRSRLMAKATSASPRWSPARYPTCGPTAVEWTNTGCPIRW